MVIEAAELSADELDALAEAIEHLPRRRERIAESREDAMAEDDEPADVAEPLSPEILAELERRVDDPVEQTSRVTWEQLEGEIRQRFGP